MLQTEIGFADTGNITIAGNIAAYTRTDNKNARTLQYFSTSADTKMRHNEMISEAYYDDFQKFVNFYGTFEYSDRIIQAAFAKFSITLGGKELDFSNYRYNGRKRTY